MSSDPIVSMHESVRARRALDQAETLIDQTVESVIADASAQMALVWATMAQAEATIAVLHNLDEACDHIFTLVEQVHAIRQEMPGGA